MTEAMQNDRRVEGGFEAGLNVTQRQGKAGCMRGMCNAGSSPAIRTRRIGASLASC